MLRILVTGGAGFVGSHLCERLAYENDVYSIDNYFTGSKDNHVDGVEYIKMPTHGLQLSHLPRFDLVYHLGEYSRVEQSFDDINIVHKYNIDGTYQVLEAVRNWGAKLVYSGSSTKFTNDDDFYTMSPYAFFKKQNTELVKQYSEWFNIRYAITYFYNVYGPREISSGKYSTVIAKFNELMKQGIDLPVTIPGTQKRNFTHVNDIVDALVLIGIRGDGDEYGIGHPDSYSILEVAEMFGGKIVLTDPKKGNRMSAEVKTEKTYELGWQPKHNLKDYIESL